MVVIKVRSYQRGGRMAGFHFMTKISRVDSPCKRGCREFENGLLLSGVGLPIAI